jgi:hypothetical protein
VLGLDANFLKRVQKSGFLILLVALLVSLQWASPPLSLGLLAGWALSAGTLGSWQWVASNALSSNRSRMSLGILLLKLPLLGALVWFLMAKGWVSPIGLAAGAVVPQAAVVVLALGRHFGHAPDERDPLNSPATTRVPSVSTNTMEGGGHVGSCA